MFAMGSEELRAEGGWLVAVVGTALDPDLRDAAVLPVGEERDAIAGREDFFDMVLESGQGQIEVDGLRNLVGRLHIEGDAGEDAERAEMDRRAREFFGIAGMGEMDDVAAGVDEFESCCRGREIAVVEAGTVRRCCYGSGDGDVREGGEVVKGKAACIDDGG
jgi:hypothetical protein